ncbi:pyridoxine 5'-phosphate synthase [Anaeromyxobacter paludicola]|uniref:Pyridoxine 5'-phosphate synthase n=1 Tax=Anaeromyxobacter paludicola TaxID=2918171 RepID=A0ABN6N3T7_9BACT|nr:pyridoxine 5'-phosphate synthase [Anaeromyxobacter paludicola]BDG07849.1 pyridoxine 5'-phosphate synthase [Anaeromyxobacter paludicola]
MPARLGVNVDHVATLRQARRAAYPDPVAAALLAELAGADQITVHLREDRRHVQDRDVEVLRRTVASRLNLEMAAVAPMVELARRLRPDVATLVPERRQELTTEGGLDVAGRLDEVRAAVGALREAGIEVSLFVDPDLAQVDAARAAGADAVEIHTGRYCDAPEGPARDQELHRIVTAARAAAERKLRVAAGHGLHYRNVLPVAAIPEITELNIGHAIVAQAVLVGLERAVREMKDLLALGAAGR